MATAPPTFTTVAGVCAHLRNGARRLLRKVPELELAAQNGHCALFASMIHDNELGGDAYCPVPLTTARHYSHSSTSRATSRFPGTRLITRH